MSISPMIEQVNRILGNMLAWSGEATLPGIGSLFVERHAAKRLSKRSVLPPCRVVEFTSQVRGASLVDEIARMAQIDVAQAQDIYDRWLTHVKEGDVLAIVGVGVLKFKNFTPDPAFDKLLNPQGHEPVRIRPVRRFDWVLWFGVAIIVLVLAGGAALWMTDGNPLSGLFPEKMAIEQVVEKRVAEVADIQPEAAGMSEQSVEEPAVSIDASQSDKQTANNTTAPAAQPVMQSQVAAQSAKVAGTPEAPAEFAAGHRYVVLGVFSTAENAARAIQDAIKKDPSLRCSVFRFGAKLLVSPFDAADTEPCTQFIREKADEFPGMWTYTAK